MRDKKLKNIRLREKSIIRRRRKKKKRLKRHNNYLNKRIKPTRDKITKNKRTNQIEIIEIDAGFEFSLVDKPELVIDVVHKLDYYKKDTSSIRNIIIDLSKIKTIDIGAINFLLAKINEFTKHKRVTISGRMPENPTCKKLFIDSGFLDYMYDLSGKRFKKNSDSFIINVGSDQTMNEKVGQTIEKSMKFLTGIEQKYPPVYSIIQEICSNSVEWAKNPNSKSKNWFLGIYFQQLDNEPHICFSLTDIGYGILHTLNRKFGTIIKETLNNTNEMEILLRAFEKKYSSKSGEPNRNKGMPLIKNRFEKHYICNLKVITNNVLLDFSDNTKSRIIHKNFPGTFYFWSINKKNLDIWKH